MKDKNSTLKALSAAALFLNTVSNPVNANPPDQKVSADYRYTNYSEGNIPQDNLAFGSENRYTIDVHQLKVKTPVAEAVELTFSATQETMSGASPWFVVADENGKPVQVMSGATIDENRTEVGVDVRTYLSNTESTYSASISTENDYKSFAAGYSGQWRINNNLSTLNYGVNGTQDYIDATDTDIYPNRPSDETKYRIGGFLGFSHVMTKNRIIGATVSMSILNGYLSDPYKAATVGNRQESDNRPDKQFRQSLSVSVRQFVPQLNSALHVDMRLYNNDWEINSETLDIAWYQNLGNNWQLAPSLRYYHQSEAAFYGPIYTSERSDGYYSSDYRLSEYSAYSGRLKLIKSWEKYSANLSVESYSSSGDHPGLVDFVMASFGVGVKF